MEFSALKHGFCIALLAASAALGAAACGDVGPTDDEEPLSTNEEQDDTAGTGEDIAEDAQAVDCTGHNPNAHCLTRCCSHNAWSDLGDPGWGHCTTKASNFCKNAGGPCNICWGRL